MENIEKVLRNAENATGLQCCSDLVQKITYIPHYKQQKTKTINLKTIMSQKNRNATYDL